MNFKSVKNALTSRVGRQILIGQKHSPKILFVAGVVGVTATVVLACRATLKLEEVLENAQKDIEQAKDLRESHATEYSAMDLKNDLVKIRVRTGVQIATLYGPSIVVGFAAIGALVGSHAILSKRNVSLTAAYAGLDKAYKEYRSRVVNEIGEEREHDLRHNAVRTVETVDEHGNKIKTIEKIKDPNKVSPYARFFDDRSKNWSKEPEYNLLYLRSQQNYWNDMLHSRGHVFLSEIYDSLDIERSAACIVTGWVLSEDGDNFVDFGIYDGSSLAKRDFVNGNEGSILLDFNVQGVIFDRI